MEDLNLEHEPIDQIAGITFDECTQLAKMAAGFHAAFWGHPILVSTVQQRGFFSAFRCLSCFFSAFSCASTMLIARIFRVAAMRIAGPTKETTYTCGKHG